MEAQYISLNRNLNIDFLRFIGLILIVLAHVQTPHWLHEIRCFDVPLMVFCSGLTCQGKSYGNYWKYIWKRAKRLLVPSYLFVCFFYLLFYIEEYLTTNVLSLDWIDIRNAFLLRNDSLMGFLWVIKVFLLMMFVTPLLVKLADKIKAVYLLVIVCMGFILLQQGLVQLCDYIPYKICRIIYREYLLYLTGYSALFLLGVKIGKANNIRNITLWVSIALLIVVVGTFVSIHGLPFHLLSQQYKYPPQFWFILYGAVCSVTLWMIVRTLKLKNTLSHFFVWMGQNTIWIYLWHIIGLRVDWIVSDHWAIQYFTVLAFSIAVFALQFFVVRKINKPFFNKYFVG